MLDGSIKPISPDQPLCGYICHQSKTYLIAGNHHRISVFGHIMSVGSTDSKWRQTIGMVIPTGSKFHKRLLMFIFSIGGFSFQRTNEVKTFGKEGKKYITSCGVKGWPIHVTRYPSVLLLSLFLFHFILSAHL